MRTTPYLMRLKAADESKVTYRSAQSLCVRTTFSPLRGLSVFHLYPRLTPWAAFLRRFAAGNRCHVPLRFSSSSSHAHAQSATPPQIGGQGSSRQNVNLISTQTFHRSDK